MGGEAEVGVVLVGVCPGCIASSSSASSSWVVEGQSDRLVLADFPNLMAVSRCFQSGPTWRFQSGASNLALPTILIFLPALFFDAFVLRPAGLMFAVDIVRASQIASIDRLPDWLCRQIGQIVTSARLHQIGIIARLALIDSRQIEGLPRLPD